MPPKKQSPSLLPSLLLLAALSVLLALGLSAVGGGNVMGGLSVCKTSGLCTQHTDCCPGWQCGPDGKGPTCTPPTLHRDPILIPTLTLPPTPTLTLTPTSTLIPTLPPIVPPTPPPSTITCNAAGDPCTFPNNGFDCTWTTGPGMKCTEHTCGLSDEGNLCQKSGNGYDCTGSPNKKCVKHACKAGEEGMACQTGGAGLNCAKEAWSSIGVCVSPDCDPTSVAEVPECAPGCYYLKINGRSIPVSKARQSFWKPWTDNLRYCTNDGIWPTCSNEINDNPESYHSEADALGFSSDYANHLRDVEDPNCHDCPDCTSFQITTTNALPDEVAMNTPPTPTVPSHFYFYPERDERINPCSAATYNSPDQSDDSDQLPALAASPVSSNRTLAQLLPAAAPGGYFAACTTNADCAAPMECLGSCTPKHCQLPYYYLINYPNHPPFCTNNPAYEVPPIAAQEGASLPAQPVLATGGPSFDPSLQRFLPGLLPLPLNQEPDPHYAAFLRCKEAAKKMDMPANVLPLYQGKKVVCCNQSNPADPKCDEGKKALTRRSNYALSDCFEAPYTNVTYEASESTFPTGNQWVPRITDPITLDREPAQIGANSNGQAILCTTPGDLQAAPYNLDQDNAALQASCGGKYRIVWKWKHTGTAAAPAGKWVATCTNKPVWYCDDGGDGWHPNASPVCLKPKYRFPFGPVNPPVNPRQGRLVKDLAFQTLVSCQSWLSSNSLCLPAGEQCGVSAAKCCTIPDAPVITGSPTTDLDPRNPLRCVEWPDTNNYCTSNATCNGGVGANCTGGTWVKAPKGCILGGGHCNVDADCCEAANFANTAALAPGAGGLSCAAVNGNTQRTCNLPAPGPAASEPQPPVSILSWVDWPAGFWNLDGTKQRYDSYFYRYSIYFTYIMKGCAATADCYQTGANCPNNMGCKELIAPLNPPAANPNPNPPRDAWTRNERNIKILNARLPPP